jgi:energy-coupling factor transport system permease protein
MIFHILHMADSLMNYEPSDKFMHLLNPITKLAIFLVVVIGGMYVSGPDFPWWLNAGIFVILVVMSLMGGVPLRRELQLRGTYIVAITLIILVGNLIFARGGESTTSYNLHNTQVYFSIPPFIYVSSVSVNFALSKTFFILNSILVIIAILKTTRLADLTHSVQTLGVPYPVAMLTSTSLRCVPMVTDGLLIVYNAQRARGLEMDKGGMAARVKQWGALLSPLMIVLLKWTDLMALVFQSRGLDFGRKQRTRLRVLPFRWADWAITTVVLGGLAAFIVLYQLRMITFNVG